jgi:hypothetical protein
MTTTAATETTTAAWLQESGIAPQGTTFATPGQGAHYTHRPSAAHIAEIIAEQRAAKLAKKKTGAKLYFFAAA